MAMTADDPGLAPSFLNKALEGMILSASGWRGVFAADGDEESPHTEIDPAHRVISVTAALVFAEYLKQTSGNAHPTVIVGMDTRPTGPAIANCAIRALLREGCEVRFAGITAAPEIMAYARHNGSGAVNRTDGPAAGFIYISASHNPIGHNGIKFGLTDGGVLPGDEAKKLIEGFRARISGPAGIKDAVSALNRADSAALTQVYTGADRIKADAYSAYLHFTREVVSGFGATAAGEPKQRAFFDFLRDSLKKTPLGIATDLNGSARTLSIDREFLSPLGITLHTINDKPGEIAHRIVPEGESLEPCRRFLEEAHQKDPAFILGYVPDCDGDRGNLVIWDEALGHGRSLEAQEVFALACVSELAHLVWTGELSYDNKGKARQKVAVAVNDPTSMRIDRIAQAFDVSVFRAEVGEANVVGLARRLREQGYTVRILGEGSAGGNITHPSAVRDPIDTVLALVKLLAIRSTGDRKGFFELWCSRSGKPERYRPDFTLADVIAALPAFVTTGAYSGDALLHVETADHAVLKDRYQALFLKEWEERKDLLKTRYGISGWDGIGYTGLEEKRGITRFGEAGRGGLKVSFSDEAGREIACIWMRGSGTEPVFRVMADAERADAERYLIEWQRHLVTQADQGLT
ncbi:phosphoglucomutase [Spirochaetia bacterium]|nr:phosphoglucomutase [Spirochaetia bacterium]